MLKYYTGELIKKERTVKYSFVFFSFSTTK